MNLIKFNDKILTKFIYTAKIHSNQGINCLLTKAKKLGNTKLKNSTALIDYSQTIDDGYINSEDYNPTKKRKVEIVFYDMIADVEANKILSCVVTLLFLRKKTQYFTYFYLEILL